MTGKFSRSLLLEIRRREIPIERDLKICLSELIAVKQERVGTTSCTQSMTGKFSRSLLLEIRRREISIERDLEICQSEFGVPGRILTSHKRSSRPKCGKFSRALFSEESQLAENFSLSAEQCSSLYLKKTNRDDLSQGAFCWASHGARLSIS